jgi:hypothetical protein
MIANPVKTNNQGEPAETSSFVRILHLWQLLSFDAPSAAALWAWFIAATLRVKIPKIAPVAISLMVWIFCVGDRLLDSRQESLQASSDEALEERHHFHHQHRSGLFAGIACVVIPFNGSFGIDYSSWITILRNAPDALNSRIH